MLPGGLEGMDIGDENVGELRISEWMEKGRRG